MKLSKRITRMQVLRQVGLWKKSRRAVRLKKPAKRKLRIIDDEVLRQPNKLKEEESDDSDEDRQKNELKHEESGDSDEDRQMNELKHEESGDSDEDRQKNELKHEESGDSDDRQMNELKHDDSDDRQKNELKHDELKHEESGDSDDRQKNEMKHEESGDSDEDQMNELKHEESGDSDEDRQKNELKHEESGDSDDRQMNELKHEESGDSYEKQKFRRFRRTKYSPTDLYDRERDGIYDERIEEYRAYAKTAIDVFNQGGCAKYSVVDIHTFRNSHIGSGAALKSVTFTAKRDKDRVEDAKSFVGGITHHYDGRREFSFVRFLKPWLL